MIYHGKVSKGVVVFEGGPSPPEGAQVRVEPIFTVTEPTPEDGPSFADELLDLTGGIDDLPADFALNHDHYLHGQPKR